jgi:hypothetical protein
MGSPEPTFSSRRLHRALNIFALWASLAVSGLTSVGSTAFGTTAGLGCGSGTATGLGGFLVSDAVIAGLATGGGGLDAATGVGKACLMQVQVQVQVQFPPVWRQLGMPDEQQGLTALRLMAD